MCKYSRATAYKIDKNVQNCHKFHTNYHNIVFILYHNVIFMLHYNIVCMRTQMWVMDAKFMPNCHKIVIASTKRDLRFYDIAGNQMIEDYDLYGLNNVPHCLAYHYNEKVWL